MSESSKLNERSKSFNVDENNIIKTIVELMNKVENVLDMSGADKKVYVLNEIKKILGYDLYERYSYFIVTFIDFVVNVSKNKSGIEINKIKRKFKCCC